MGYRPDPILRQLASYKSSSKDTRIQSSIAWINNWKKPSDFFKQSEFKRYFEGAKETASNHGYNLETFNIQELDVTPKRLRTILSSRGIRGVIIPPHPRTYKIPYKSWRDFAVLRIGFDNPSSKRHIVCPDQFEGGRLAAQKMHEAGYRRIGYLSNKNKELRSRYNFLASFQTTRDLLNPNSKFIPPLILESSVPSVKAKASYKSWLKEHNIDAVFTGLSFAINWTHELGLRIGPELGIAGTSIHDSGTDSGIDQRPFEIGAVATQFLTRLISLHEFGIPEIPQRHLITPLWVSGSSLKKNP